MEVVFELQTEQFELQASKLLLTVTDNELQFLTKAEIEKLTSYTANKRKCEFMSSRVVLKQMLAQEYSPIRYTEFGKPCLPNAYLGISHSKDYVAIITSKTKNVSVDIEQYRESVLKIKSKFCNNIEDIEFVTLHDVTILWSAKEVLFKLLNASVDFKENYSVTKINEKNNCGELQGIVKTKSIEKTIKMSYFYNQFFCIVWAAE